MKFSEYLTEPLMFLDLSCQTKTEALEFLVHKFCDCYHFSCQQELLGKIQEREEIGSTGLGKGVAVPHGKIDVVDKLYVVFGRSQQGLKWGSKDGVDVNYIFLVIGPSTLIREYLDVLSQISKVALRHNVREVLEKTNEVQEIIEAVHVSGERHHKRDDLL